MLTPLVERQTNVSSRNTGTFEQSRSEFPVIYDVVHMTRFSCSMYNVIKQIRVFVGFILQPEMKLLKIVPDPENKYQKEMIFSNFTIRSELKLLLPSGIND